MELTWQGRAGALEILHGGDTLRKEGTFHGLGREERDPPWRGQGEEERGPDPPWRWQGGEETLNE